VAPGGFLGLRGLAFFRMVTLECSVEGGGIVERLEMERGVGDNDSAALEIRFRESFVGKILGHLMPSEVRTGSDLNKHHQWGPPRHL
jgi:hypothetical protein